MSKRRPLYSEHDIICYRFVVRNGRLFRKHQPNIPHHPFSTHVPLHRPRLVKKLAPEVSNDPQQRTQDLPGVPSPMATTAKQCTKRKLLDPVSPSSATAVHFVPASHISIEAESRAAKRLKVWPESTAMRRTRAPWPYQNDKGTPIRPMGLFNRGNFCYRRSFLQCMFHAPDFVQWLKVEASTHDHQSSKHSCLACGLYALVETVWTRQNPQQAVTRFDAILRGLAPRYRFIDWLGSSSQHDSHEVFTWLFGALVEEADTLHASRIALARSPTPSSLSLKKKAIDRVDAVNSLALKNIFHLTTSGTWTCPSCRLIHTSCTTAEAGLQLGIQQAPPTAQDLSDHLAAYFNQIVPDMTCERSRCKTKGPRTRNIAITSFPRVLVIQFARFTQTYDARLRSFKSGKCSRPVRYPLDLDISDYAVEELRTSRSWDQNKNMAKYRLSSVVAHHGSLNGGHYVAYAESPAGVMRLDDERVSATTTAEMMGPSGGFTPYLLFYRSVV